MMALQKIRFVLTDLARFYPLAGNLREKAGVVRFFLKFAVTYFLPRRFHREDTAISLRGTKYIFGLGSREIDTFEEFYRDRVYDRVDHFIPRSGWTIIDIGANVGMFTIRQAQRGARVFSFEPNPDCYRRLSMAIAENRLTNRVSIYNYAVGSKPGVGKMLIPSTNMRGNDLPLTVLGSVISVEDTSPTHTSSVKITSLDCIVPSLEVERIDLLKIDVEGAEVEVLRGATQTLGIVERIIVEYHSKHLLEQLHEVLNNHGFSQVFQVGSNYTADAGLLYTKRSVPIIT